MQGLIDPSQGSGLGRSSLMLLLPKVMGEGEGEGEGAGCSAPSPAHFVIMASGTLVLSLAVWEPGVVPST